MGVNSLPKTDTRQRRDCDLNPGPSAPESSTLTTRRLPSHWHIDTERNYVAVTLCIERERVKRYYPCPPYPAALFAVASPASRPLADGRLLLLLLLLWAFLGRRRDPMTRRRLISNSV